MLTEIHAVQKVFENIWLIFAVFDKDSQKLKATLGSITKRLEICIDINIEISEVDHYTEVGGGGTNKSGGGEGIWKMFGKK